VTTYAVVRQVDMREDRRYVDRAKEHMRQQIGHKLSQHIKIDTPTLVQIEAHEVENWPMRSIEVGYLIEFVECRQHRMRPLEMDGFMVLMPRTVERPRPIFVDRPVIQRVEVEKIVEVDRPQPTFWQRVSNHLKSLAAEVQYDGGYGEPD